MNMMHYDMTHDTSYPTLYLIRGNCKGINQGWVLSINLLFLLLPSLGVHVVISDFFPHGLSLNWFWVQIRNKKGKKNTWKVRTHHTFLCEHRKKIFWDRPSWSLLNIWKENKNFYVPDSTSWIWLLPDHRMGWSELLLTTQERTIMKGVGFSFSHGLAKKKLTILISQYHVLHQNLLERKNANADVGKKGYCCCCL